MLQQQASYEVSFNPNPYFLSESKQKHLDNSSAVDKISRPYFFVCLCKKAHKKKETSI